MLSVVGASSSSASMVCAVEGIGEPREIRFHAVEPKRVGIDQKERRVAELRQRLGDAAAGAEEFGALVGNNDMRMLARREVLLHRVGEMMHIDDGAFDAGIRQPVQTVIDQ